MGWLYMPRSSMGGHASPKAYLDDQFTYQRPGEDGTTRGLEVLASSCPGNRVYYAAVQIMTDGAPGEVFAVICLIRWNPRDKEGMVFGYKDMDETVGPYETDCPARILDLLTPTDRPYALAWRERCRANLALKARVLRDGDRIRFDTAMTFTDGHEAQEFIVRKSGRKVSLRDPATGGGYRVSRLMERAWSLVPETRVHKTLFS